MYKRLFMTLLTSFAMLIAGCGGGSGNNGNATVGIPESISLQPASSTAVTGSSATFSVSASGDNLIFQWQNSKDAGATWVDIPGAIAAAYTIATVDTSMNGWQYRVLVTGSTGAIISSAATLTAVNTPVPAAITTQPGSQIVTVGASASFSVTATGSSVSYRWQASLDGSLWTDVPDATGSTLTLASVTAADNGKSYRVIVSNATNSVTSAPALLTVSAASAAPFIGTQPASTSVVALQSATFNVIASGAPVLTYQWQVSTNSGASFNDIALATAASYATGPTAAGDSGKVFRVKVSNSVASVTSSNAVLTVTATDVAPVVNVQPASKVVFTPYTGSFSVIVSGSPGPIYQWQLSTDGGSSFSNINGATGASYATPATTAAQAGVSLQYRVVVTNTAGSTVSHPAAMTVVDSGMGGFVYGIASDTNGNIYASVTPGGTSGTTLDARATFYGITKLDAAGTVSAVAGSATEGHTDGTGASATFYSPFGIAVDGSGNIFVADWGVNAIRKVSAAGVVTTFAGGDVQGGFVNGVGTQASFHQPESVAVDGGGNVYVTDRLNFAIRKITSSGAVSTFAGGTGGTADGVGTAAKFNSPMGIASDAAGNLLVTDATSLRTISPQGVVVTLTTSSTSGMFTDPASLGNALYGVARDAAGNAYVSVLDGNIGYSIRKVTAAGVVSTVTGSTSLRSPSFSLVVDAAGNVFASDTAGDLSNYAVIPAKPYTIRKITPAGTSTELP